MVGTIKLQGAQVKTQLDQKAVPIEHWRRALSECGTSMLGVTGSLDAYFCNNERP